MIPIILINHGEEPLDVLNTTAGHLKFSFDTEEDAKKAKKVLEDMMQRGYFIFVETSRGLRRVKHFNPKRNVYIIEGGEDVPEATLEAAEPATLDSPGPIPDPDTPYTNKGPKRRGHPPKGGYGMPAKTTKATGVAPIGGG